MKLGDLLIAVIVVMVWGGNFVAMRIGVMDLPPYMALSLRMLIASAILVWFLKSPKGQLGLLFVISATMSTLHFGLGLVGVQYIDAGAGAIAMQTSVPFAALLAWVVYREAFGWQRFTGMLIAFTGIVTIAGSPTLSGNLIMLGIMVISAFFFAVASLCIRKLKDIDFVSLNGWVSVLALPQAILISICFESNQFFLAREATLPTWIGVVYMAIGATIVGQGFWYRLLARYEVNKVMPFTLLVPVFGVFFGAVFLQESVTVQMLTGGLITIGGVAIILLHRGEKGLIQ